MFNLLTKKAADGSVYGAHCIDFSQLYARQSEEFSRSITVLTVVERRWAGEFLTRVTLRERNLTAIVQRSGMRREPPRKSAHASHERRRCFSKGIGAGRPNSPNWQTASASRSGGFQRR
jgi:hypothetical protein